jgi:penicillin amidase
MKRVWRSLGIVLVLAILVPLLAIGGGWLWLRRGVPDFSGTFTLPGLSESVEVAFDANAVPHIFARSDNDAYFTLGWLHARDRMWQMDVQRRVGAGRLSELIGSSGLRTDRFMRTMGFYRQAELSYDALAPEVRAGLDAYAAGVNAWLTQRSEPLPIEFQLLRHQPDPWKPADSLVWGKLMALQLSENYRHELMRARLLQRLPPDQVRDLYPDYPADAPISMVAALQNLDFDRLWAALPPPLGPSTASNEWVVAGNRTDTGKPILVNDPHLALNAPVLWYLARIETPDLSLTGATVPGVPFHLLGHNNRIAWGFTTTGGDVQDLYVERLDPADPDRYLTPDGSLPFTVREETIRISDGTEEKLNVRLTRHGPVLSDIEGDAGQIAPSGQVVALAFTGFSDKDTTAEALYQLNRAADWDEFREALRSFVTPQQNIVYADGDGNIGFLVPGAVPVRQSGNGYLPVPGWTDDYSWTGPIPFDELPQLLNPAKGRIVNANNRVVGPDYPHFIAARWDDWFRAGRIEQVLDGESRHSVVAAERLLADTLSLPARDLLPLMLGVKAEGTLATDALRLLRVWDGTMKRDRAEPLIFEWWLRELNRTLYADELGPLFADFWSLNPRVVRHMLTDVPRWCDDVTTADRTESCGDILLLSLDRALEALHQRHGSDVASWRWGAEHRAPFPHQVLDRLPMLNKLFDIGIEADGGNFTVNRGGSSVANEAAPFSDRHGAGYRAIYDLADLSRSRFIIATGQSGNPLSPHYGDLRHRWRDGQHIAVTGSLDEVTSSGLGRLSLEPQ